MWMLHKYYSSFMICLNTTIVHGSYHSLSLSLSLPFLLSLSLFTPSTLLSFVELSLSLSLLTAPARALALAERLWHLFSMTTAVAQLCLVLAFHSRIKCRRSRNRKIPASGALRVPPETRNRDKPNRNVAETKLTWMCNGIGSINCNTTKTEIFQIFNNKENTIKIASKYQITVFSS